MAAKNAKLAAVPAQQRFHKAASLVAETLRPRDLAKITKLLRILAKIGPWGPLGESSVERDECGIEYHAFPAYNEPDLLRMERRSRRIEADKERAHARKCTAKTTH